MKINGKKNLFFFVLTGLFLAGLFWVNQSYAIDDPCASKSGKDKVDCYDSLVTQLGSQAKTLSNQIAQYNAQINLTQYKIADTESKIELLGGRITQLEGSLNDLTVAFSSRAVETYKLSRFENNFLFLMTATDVTDAVSRYHYLQKIQEEDRGLLSRLQEAQTTYVGQKQDQETLQTQLKTQQTNLNAQKKAKAALLADTQGSETKYQTLLSAAQAQLASFSRFAANLGGASPLSNQTSCDDWGCYYNQRDSQWGALSLNGTQYSLASDGCLVTAMAMMLTHYGHKSVTPATINANPNNFASYYPAYLKYTIQVDGVTAQRIVTVLDLTLSSGNPVVVGINAYGGTHFVVIKSGAGGNYVMNDPFLPNGKNVNFTDHYSVGSIFEIAKVVLQ